MKSPQRPRPETNEPLRPGPRRRTVYTLSEEETVEFGRSLARGLRGGELILLDGELGLGKTVLTRGIALGLGIAPEDVNSPSFTLVQEYCGGRVPMFHVDLYRIEEDDELESLGLDEILAAGAVTVVEWGEKLPHRLRSEAIALRFFDMGEDSRRIEMQSRGTGPRVRRGDA